MWRQDCDIAGRQSDLSFGPSRVSGRSSCSAVVVRSPDEETLRDSVRSECPQSAGVYGMFDDDGRWIYVGKSKRLRMNQHRWNGWRQSFRHAA